MLKLARTKMYMEEIEVEKANSVEKGDSV